MKPSPDIITDHRARKGGLLNEQKSGWKHSAVVVRFETDGNL